MAAKQLSKLRNDQLLELPTGKLGKQAISTGRGEGRPPKIVNEQDGRGSLLRVKQNGIKKWLHVLGNNIVDKQFIYKASPVLWIRVVVNYKCCNISDGNIVL